MLSWCIIAFFVVFIEATLCKSHLKKLFFTSRAFTIIFTFYCGRLQAWGRSSSDCQVFRQTGRPCAAIPALVTSQGLAAAEGSGDTQLDARQLHLSPLIAPVHQFTHGCLLDNHCLSDLPLGGIPAKNSSHFHTEPGVTTIVLLDVV